MLRRLRIADDQRGATAIEYGLVAALIALGIMAGLSGLSSGVAALWAQIVQQLQSVL